jgi:hypothetical protein
MHTAQQVLAMEARDDLRHAGRAARELEHRAVARIELYLAQCLARRGQGGSLYQLVEIEKVAAALRPRHDQAFKGGKLCAHALREANEIEGAEIRLNEIKRRAGELGELPDLDLAVLRHGAYRNDAGLEAGGEGHRRLEHRAHLEDRALAGLHAQ